jgi:hypothetical protein
MFIEDPSENSIATFHFTVSLEEGATFIFGLWVCIADGVGNFHRHLVDIKKSETPASTPCCDLDNFVDGLGEVLLPDLVREIESESKCKRQPSQDNRPKIVKKLEKGAIVSCYSCHQEGHKSYECKKKRKKIRRR